MLWASNIECDSMGEACCEICSKKAANYLCLICIGIDNELKDENPIIFVALHGSSLCNIFDPKSSGVVIVMYDLCY